MKKIIILISIISILFSCNKSEIPTNSNQLNGNWFMKSYTVFGPTNSDLYKEYINWNFDISINKLKIVNYYTQSIYGFPTGVYNFTYTENEIFIAISETVTVRYDYSFNNNNLILSNHPELDGPEIYFIKNENSCVNNPLEDLQWLKEIKQLMEIQTNMSGSQIIQYLYNNECVYAVDNCYNCPDDLITIYNASGEIICEFGGISGENTCLNFYEEATNRRYLFNNVNSYCNQNVLIDENLYNNVNNEPTINNLGIDNDCLTITYSETGCDGNWTVRLIDSEEILPSTWQTPQRNLKLSIVNTELCQTEITQEESFNINELQVKGSNEVILNIQENQIHYYC